MIYKPLWQPYTQGIHKWLGISFTAWGWVAARIVGRLRDVHAQSARDCLVRGPAWSQSLVAWRRLMGTKGALSWCLLLGRTWRDVWVNGAFFSKPESAMVLLCWILAVGKLTLPKPSQFLYIYIYIKWGKKTSGKSKVCYYWYRWPI